MKALLIEITGYDPVAAMVKTLYFSTARMNPFPPTDTDRPNIYYKALVKEVGPVPRFLYGSGRTYGRSSNEGGYLLIDNSDNSQDYLIDWGFDGRSIKYYRGTVGQAFNIFVPELSGTLEQPEFTFSKSQPSQIKFIIRDKWALFNKPISTATYAGTNSGSTGNEGTADDLKGKGKPFCIGAAFNVTAVTVNAPGLRFQLHDGPINDAPACYIGGVAQTKVTAPPGAAQYSIDTSTGIATLGSSPGGDEVTFDVQGAKFSGTYVNKCADLVSKIAQTYGGITVSEVNSTAVTALNALNAAPVELYYPDASTVTISDALDALLNSIGAYAFFDKLGVLQMGRLSDPSGMTSIKTLSERDFAEFEMIQANDEDKGVPVFKVTVNHTVNYTKQTKVAGSVSEARKTWLGLEKRSESATDASVKTAHLLSPELSRDTHLTSASDAATEASRVLALRKIRHGFYKAVVDYEANADLYLADCITVLQPRLLMAAGRKMVITGMIPHSPEDNQLTLELWG